MSNVRLSTAEISNLKENLYKIDPNAGLWLFGSRTDPDKRGGDIDLLIISDSIGYKELIKLKISFYSEFGEQKMDIVVDDGTFKEPFNKLIKEKAIEL